jgi:thiamine phosphate synthase YjbQ (UPF0047 family)
MKSCRQELHSSITYGGFDLGTREQIFYSKFDGRRGKRVVMKTIGV